MYDWDIRGVTKDESRYPPRCCKKRIPVEQRRLIVKWEVMTVFLDKMVERNTVAKNRTYCSNRECGVFVRPENVKIRNKTVTCPRCGSKTCIKCKRVECLPTVPCHDSELQGALNLIQENRWQRCKGCGTGVERTPGCNQMQ